MYSNECVGWFAVGHGLVCHRVIQELCTLIGIKDIYVKLEGSTRNYRAVIKGFFTILRQQVNFSHTCSVLDFSNIATQSIL